MFIKYIFVVGKSTQKIMFLLTPAGIGDFKSVIRISPSYKNKTKRKNRVVGVTVSLFTIEKKLICMCDRSFTVGHSTGFLTLQLKQHVLKPGKPNSPEHVNWITETERKNEYFTDWVGVSVYLVFFYALPIDRLAGVFRVPFWCFRAYHVRGCKWGSLLNV